MKKHQLHQRMRCNALTSIGEQCNNACFKNGYSCNIKSHYEQVYYNNKQLNHNGGCGCSSNIVIEPISSLLNKKSYNKKRLMSGGA